MVTYSSVLHNIKMKLLRTGQFSRYIQNIYTNTIEQTVYILGVFITGIFLFED